MTARRALRRSETPGADGHEPGPRPNRGGSIATTVLDRLDRDSPAPLEVAVLVAIVAAFGLGCAYVLAQPRMLGHDESVYAVMARSWLTGAPDTGVFHHRAPLLPVLGLPVFALGGGESALRAIGVAGGAALIVATWWLARRIGGGLAGLGAAAVVATSPTVLEEGRDYLTDVPAAAAVVAMTAVIWWQLEERPTADRRLLLVAPLAWAAYHLRYGSALPVAVIFATAAVMCRPGIRRAPRLVAATLGLLVVLLVPHLVRSTVMLGSPVARVLETSRVAGRDYWGQGLIEYVRWFPFELAGPVAAVLMTVGIAGAVSAWVRSDPDRRPLAFLVLPATITLVAVGVASHGEPRFVLVSVALWCAAGAVVVARAVRAVAARTPALAWGAVALSGLLLIAFFALVVRRDARVRDRLAARDAPFVAALQALAAEAGSDCSVLSSYTPQVTWYTSCATYHFSSPPEAGRERLLTDDAWMLLLEDGKRQPEGELLAGYASLAEAPPRVWTRPGARSAQLYRLDPPGEDRGVGAASP